MNKSSVISKVIKELGASKWLILLSALLAIINVFFTLCIPLIIGDAVNLIIGKGNVDFDTIGMLLMRASICTIGAAVTGWVMNTLNTRISYSSTASLRKKAFAKLQHLPFSYIDSHPHGDTVGRMISDTEQFGDGLILGFSQLFTGVATIIGTLIFMITTSPTITVAVMVLTPLSVFVARYISSHTYSMFKKQTETRGTQTAFIEEHITNAKTVKAYRHEKASLDKFNTINENMRKYSLSAMFFSSLVNPTTRFLNNIVYAAVALIGGLLAISPTGGLTVGALTAMLAYVNHYTKPFNEISGVVAELQGSFAAVARLFELLEAEVEPPDKPDAQNDLKASGNFSLENVSFSYTPTRKLIEQLSLEAKQGQRIAIVGPTGCGKTTLINLLMRFYEVNGGCIRLDGKSIADITRPCLRSNIGMVLQETWLKRGTVKENIMFGKPDATDEEIIAAAKATDAHSFIKRLPNGYDTYIDEDGGNLSAGQKQLLCITRIMLDLPPVLILDEATSSIDTMTERRIGKAFDAIMKGKTSFIVAHRLSTIQNADKIIVMNNGSIVEQGTHIELLNKKGHYFNLYNSQFNHNGGNKNDRIQLS